MPQHKYSDIRVGIIGAGLMGRWHAHAAAKLGAQITAIADNDPGAADALSQKHPGATPFPDVAQLLDKADIDAVHICTPPESHTAIVSGALDSTVHVLVEKPVTPTADETKILLQRAKERDVILCPVHQFAFQRGVGGAMNALDSLGEVLRVTFRTHSAGADGMQPDAADRVVADILPHPLSVLQKLFPGCLEQASEWRLLQVRSGEFQLIGRVGTFGVNFDISMHARPTRCEMDIACEHGRVYLNFFHGYSVIERGNVSRLQKAIQPMKYTIRECAVSTANLLARLVRGEPAYPGLQSLVDGFYQAILDGGEGPVPAADILSLADVRDQLVQGGLPGGDYKGPDK